MNIRTEFKANRLVYLLIACFILLICLNLAANLFPVEYGRAKIFILDNFIVERTFNNNSMVHGEIVKNVIENIDDKLNLTSYNVSQSKGIKEELYLAGLKEAIAYKKANPKREVLVNVSLAFSGYSEEHQTLIEQALTEGVVIVAAAGNDDLREPIYPAGFSGVIAVANASRIGKDRSSNYGEYIDLSAPGQTTGVISNSFNLGISYLHSRGTSFSAPRVVATLAKLLELDKELTPTEGLDIIYQSTSKIYSNHYLKEELGSGLLNTARAIRRVNLNYWLLDQAPMLFLFIIFALISTYLLIKYRVVALFFIILLGLVLLPTMLFSSRLLADLTLYSYNVLVDYGFSNYLLVLIMIVQSIIILFSSWSKMIKAVVSTLLILSNLILVGVDLYYLSYFNTIGLLVLLLVSEYLAYAKFKAEDGLEDLVAGLASNCKRVRLLAKDRLLKQKDLDLDRVATKLELAKESEVYLTLMRLLVNRAEYITRLLNLLVKKDLTELEIKQVFTKLEPEVVGELLDILLNKKEFKEEIIIILKEQDQQLLIRLLENRLSLESDFQSLWEVLAEFSFVSAKLSKQLVDLFFASNNTWQRYYMLKLLTLAHPQAKNLLPLLRVISQEEEDLLRLEAEKMLKKLDKVDKT